MIEHFGKPIVDKTMEWLGAGPGERSAASEENKASIASGVGLEDFVAYMEQHNYIYRPTRETWPAKSVNARLGWIPLRGPDGAPLYDSEGGKKTLIASAWLDRHAPAEQVAWAPGEPELIRDRLVGDGAWISRQGVTCFNLYRPPSIVPGDPGKAGPWLDHGHKVFPDDAEHLIKWIAHRRQRPGEKINHGIVLGSADQGIGKDTWIAPAKQAVGPWNFSEPNPGQIMARFNGYVKAVIMRINEARDLGDVSRYDFYDHMKAYCAAPPDVLRCDEKNLREHNVINCVGPVITTNHKAAGLYLPAEDRRHFVAWSPCVKEDFDEAYWNRLWKWYEAEGGYAHVTAYLDSLDLSAFDPKAPPPKTQAFWDIVDSNRAPEDAEMADTLDALGNPDAVTLGQLKTKAKGEFFEWLCDRRNRRVILFRLEACGYTAVRNDADKHDGQWKISGSRQAVYARQTLSIRDRIAAARRLVSDR
jgi:hypothetical protein